jgi:hypothetical protein
LSIFPLANFLSVVKFERMGNTGLVLLFRDWMEGPWGSLDPDVVDQETGNFWRGLYKLEKQFNEVPKAQSIAVKVSIKISIITYGSSLLKDTSLDSTLIRNHYIFRLDERESRRI